jgi:hypothetical protein
MRKICSENRDHYSQRPILGRRFTEVERSRRIFSGVWLHPPGASLLGFRGHTRPDAWCPKPTKKPGARPGFLAAAAIGSQTSDRLPNVAKSPRQYHRRDAGRPLLRQAMRLPPRA